MSTKTKKQYVDSIIEELTTAGKTIDEIFEIAISTAAKSSGQTEKTLDMLGGFCMNMDYNWNRASININHETLKYDKISDLPDDLSFIFLYQDPPDLITDQKEFPTPPEVEIGQQTPEERKKKKR